MRATWRVRDDQERSIAARTRGLKSASTRSINRTLQEHGYDVALRQAKSGLRIRVYGITVEFRKDGSVIVRPR